MDLKKLWYKLKDLLRRSDLEQARIRPKLVQLPSDPDDTVMLHSGSKKFSDD